MQKELQLSVIPLEGYEVEFLPVERRLDDRRKASPQAPFPPGLRIDRRRSGGRREEDADELTSGRPDKLD